jgi:hypothetical protein
MTTDIIWEKIKSGRAERKFEIKVASEVIHRQFEINHDFAQKLLPYVFNEIEKENSTQKQ